MLTTIAPRPTIFSRIFRRMADMSKGIWSGNSRPEMSVEEENRARRDFIRESLNRNPDAFASELDVQFMMQAFPERF